MSSSVSPRQRDIGEVARLRAEGVDCQPQSGFPASRETEKLRSSNVDPIRTPPPAAPPLSALCARQRRTLQHRVNRNNKRQKKRPLNHKLSTITP